MHEYKSNSHKSKANQVEKQKTQAPVAKKVVSGNVRVKKKSGLSKLSDTFISEEAGNIKSYLIVDVLIPTIKNTIWDAFTNSLDMVLFGGSGKARRSNDSFSYDKQYRSNTRRVESDRPKVRNRFDMDDLEFDTRGEAERVLDEMYMVLDEYPLVRVSDLWEFAGLTAPYTSNKYGWTNLKGAKIVRTRGGWVIDLPRAMPID